MVADQIIRCAVVCVPADSSRMDVSDQSRFRPSDLVPWADPYIASLVHKLQREVREEADARRKEATLDAAEDWGWDLDFGPRILK